MVGLSEREDVVEIFELLLMALEEVREAVV